MTGGKIRRKAYVGGCGGGRMITLVQRSRWRVRRHFVLVRNVSNTSYGVSDVEIFYRSVSHVYFFQITAH